MISDDGSSSKKWACEACTFHNWTATVRCAMCGAQRPSYSDMVIPTSSSDYSIQYLPSCESTSGTSSGNSSVSDVNLDKWTCGQCTYLNWMKSTTCTACRVGLRPETISPIPGSEEETMTNNKRSNGRRKWNCSQCTYDNHMKASKCVLCLHERSSVSVSTNNKSICDLERRLKCLSVGNNKRRFISKLDVYFYKACKGCIVGDIVAVERYLAAGGDRARQITIDEVHLISLGALEAGKSLLNLAIAYQQKDIIALLIAHPHSSDDTVSARKQPPAYVSPEISIEINRALCSSLRRRKGQFPCTAASEILTYGLPSEIASFPAIVQKQLLQEIIDIGVQEELESTGTINWSREITSKLNSKLYALWNRTAGDCLLDSALQASWGVLDTSNILRNALADTLRDCKLKIYPRWQSYEELLAEEQGYFLEESQMAHDWNVLVNIAGQPGEALEQPHIFLLAHILRRPVIVYGVKLIKSLQGGNLTYARFEGVYLPLLWEQPSLCSTNPIVLGYTRGHFSALVPSRYKFTDSNGAGANKSEEIEECVFYLPLTDAKRNLLPVHFLSRAERGEEEVMLSRWLECEMTDGGLLVAKLTIRTRHHSLISHMNDVWLERYRLLSTTINLQDS